MKRTRTSIGDIYCVPIDDEYKKYFQLVAFDRAQLNSDVIRAFKNVYPRKAQPTLIEIVQGEIEFFAHCVVKWGIKLGYWEKVGTIPEVGTVNTFFRSTPDDPRVPISHNWWVWKINEEHCPVGRLEGEYRKAELGLVIAAGSLVHRLRTGSYDFMYPGFE